jgi:hypothetical protein
MKESLVVLCRLLASLFNAWIAFARLSQESKAKLQRAVHHMKHSVQVGLCKIIRAAVADFGLCT